MIKDIIQIKEIRLSYLKQAHLMGLMTFTRDQFAAFFATEKNAPAKLQEQMRVLLCRSDATRAAPQSLL